MRFRKPKSPPAPDTELVATLRDVSRRLFQWTVRGDGVAVGTLLDQAADRIEELSRAIPAEPEPLPSDYWETAE